MLTALPPALGHLTIALGLSLTPAPARHDDASRWWDLGHRIVARIADERLTPRTRQALRDILGGQSLADASVWADNIRNYRHDADPLHYVNIPLRAASYDSARDCRNGRCIIAAITADRRILADPAASPAERTEALRFLVHFMGDLHQPLHVANNGDRGGNQRVVYLAGEKTNLHAIWDGKLLEHLGETESAYLDRLRHEMDTLDLAALERGTVVDWAMEGHRIAAERAYRLPRSGRIGKRYIEANRPVIDRALIAAGVRLAKVLNEALGGG